LQVPVCMAAVERSVVTALISCWWIDMQPYFAQLK
jgi:hypothetical protein